MSSCILFGEFLNKTSKLINVYKTTTDAHKKATGQKACSHLSRYIWYNFLFGENNVSMKNGNYGQVAS